MTQRSGVLFVDDEPENVKFVVESLRDGVDGPVQLATSVTDAVQALHDHAYLLVVMDVFIPLGDHPNKVLGARAARLQDRVEHLGGLVLLEEIDRLDPRPEVLAHTACVDHVLLDIFQGRVVGRVPKPAPVDRLLGDVIEVLRQG
jgi:CheY-like chemotaxis protein